ncbi:probable LRR receptor-like serine/threonine-protein kinase At3g47570 isoform X2 [Capsicum annuum]|uniref:probable LRR receptor-like serine/threonine-protein kinase At3g47570 isoform X2 n=1 Tax=Capsicum annuum TaxID=4072 RepID=UPI001FB0F4B9|nr:probable LRR receptor-like serine/threonine-protein kinase At3g47570 isoform X2 [Capsicum annuum]
MQHLQISGNKLIGALRSGTAIAVKVFNLQLEAAFKSFDTECEVLCSLRHRNLVKVITSCSNLDFKALVLEYMPNGSLEKYLYSHNYFLDIKQRLSIMIDVACALEYLHHGCSLPVIHCDVKPSNVLLDGDMVAHLSNFGISKLLGEDQGDLYTKTLAILGYIESEYGLDGLVSTKCDVYSYGVMLLETFTRRKTNEFEGDLSLKQWVSCSLPEAVMDIVDINLVTPTEYGQDGLVSTKCDVYSYGIMLLETFTRRKPNDFEGDVSLKQWVNHSFSRDNNGRSRCQLDNTNE